MADCGLVLERLDPSRDEGFEARVDGWAEDHELSLEDSDRLGVGAAKLGVSVYNVARRVRSSLPV